MKKESLGIVYHLPKEDVSQAIHYWLTVVCQQKDIIVERVEPEFEKVYYQIGNFEQDYNEVFDGIKVICKYKE